MGGRDWSFPGLAPYAPEKLEYNSMGKTLCSIGRRDNGTFLVLGGQLSLIQCDLSHPADVTLPYRTGNETPHLKQLISLEEPVSVFNNQVRQG